MPAGPTHGFSSLGCHGLAPDALAIFEICDGVGIAPAATTSLLGSMYACRVVRVMQLGGDDFTSNEQLHAQFNKGKEELQPPHTGSIGDVDTAGLLDRIRSASEVPGAVVVVVTNFSSDRLSKYGIDFHSILAARASRGGRDGRDVAENDCGPGGAGGGEGAVGRAEGVGGDGEAGSDVSVRGGIPLVMVRITPYGEGRTIADAMAGTAGATGAAETATGAAAAAERADDTNCSVGSHAAGSHAAGSHTAGSHTAGPHTAGSHADGSDDQLAAFWATTGLGSFLTGAAAPIISPSPHLGEMITSLHAAGAAALGVFACLRSGGAPLQLSTSLYAAGQWAMGPGLAIMCKYPAAGELYAAPRSTFWETFPLATFTCQASSDGVLVQLLGLDMLERHLKPTLRALGLSVAATFAQIAWVIATQVLPNRHPTALLRFTPLFRLLNRKLASGFAKFTWSELEPRLQQHGVWYTLVRTPAQARAYPQALAAGVFDPDSGLVNPPVRFE